MPAGADGLVRLNVTYTCAGQVCQTSFWARVKPTDPSPTWQAVCDNMILDFEIGVMGRMKQLQGASVQWIGAVAITLSPLGSAQTVKGYTTDFGAVAGDILPPHDCAVLSLYSRYPGRRVHGRISIAGIPESLQNAGELTSTGEAALKNLGDWLIGQFGEAGTSTRYWWGVYSRKNGNGIGLGPPPYITYDPLAHVPWSRHVPNKRLGTNRHRKIGRGI